VALAFGSAESVCDPNGVPLTRCSGAGLMGRNRAATLSDVSRCRVGFLSAHDHWFEALRRNRVLDGTGSLTIT